MDYLAKNLNNSLLLPYDVMKIIYEYTDTLISIRKQINNKEYDLDEVMYKRMKKFIIDRISRGLGYYHLYYNNIFEVFIHKHNIHNRDYKEYLLNATGGYKNIYLYQKQSSTICGLHKCCIECYKILMICDLRCANVYKYKILKGAKYNMKNVYKKWLKL